jgi:class 3 adenylate cyclase/tetratricopeptide (TPR) repeat protein
VTLCARCGQENPDGFRFCGFCGAPLAESAPARELRKVVTVVFCDVVGSTPLGERLDPESLRRVMARYFETARGALQRHGGTVEKFIGDAVMAVFGIPQVHEDDALRAVRAACELREVLAGLNADLERDFRVRIEVRTGVNTGEVVTGTAERLATGDAVNVAARLEEAAAPGEILIGEATQRLVRDAVIAERVEGLELKGKGDRLGAWRIVAVTSGAAGVARRLDSPLVGREHERTLLAQAFERAVRERACHLFTLLGAAGVGKSRLVEEFLADFHGRAAVLRGRCLPYGEGITYWPVIEALEDAAGIVDDDPPAVAEAKLTQLRGGDATGALAGLLGLADVAPASEETFWAVRAQLETLARERPLVVVFDDIHWGEATFLDLVEHIADWSRDAPILLLCLARPELLDVRPGWAGGKLNATSVLLEPLTYEECGRLISGLLAGAELADDVRGRVAEAAEGNPLFVEEMLAMLIDDGLLRRRDGGWVAVGDLSAISVPPTIQALLSARLDRLGDEERAVIERASIEGKVFHRGAVAELAPADLRPSVSAHLLALVRKELIRPDRSSFSGDDAFRFRHLLIRDAAYAAVSKKARADLHAAYADWLEQRARERMVEYEEILAYHLEQAYRYRLELGPPGERESALARRAADLLVSAGRRALASGDLAAAQSLLDRAIELLPRGDPTRLAVLPELCYVLTEGGAFDRAREIVSEAIDCGDERIEANARVELARARLQATSEGFEAHAEEVEELERIFQRLGDDAGLAKVLFIRAISDVWLRARARETGDLLRRAREHARRAGDTRLDAEATRWLYVTSIFGPDRPEDVLHEIDALLASGPGRMLEASALNARGAFEVMLGRLADARRSIDRAIALNRELGFAVQAAAIDSHTGAYIDEVAGDLDAAAERHEAAMRELERIGEKGYLSTVAAMLANLRYARGEYEEAGRLARLAEEAAAPDDFASQIQLRAARAQVQARSGRFEEGEATAREAIALAEQTDFLQIHGRAYLALAEVLRLAGRPGDARAAIEAALALYERKGDVLAAERVRALRT